MSQSFLGISICTQGKLPCGTLSHERYSIVQMMDVRRSLKITKSIDTDLDPTVIVAEIYQSLIWSGFDCKIHISEFEQIGFKFFWFSKLMKLPLRVVLDHKASSWSIRGQNGHIGVRHNWDVEVLICCLDLGSIGCAVAARSILSLQEGVRQARAPLCLAGHAVCWHIKECWETILQNHLLNITE